VPEPNSQLSLAFTFATLSDRLSFKCSVLPTSVQCQCVYPNTSDGSETRGGAGTESHVDQTNIDMERNLATALGRVWTPLGPAAACTLPQALHPPPKAPPWPLQACDGPGARADGARMECHAGQTNIDMQKNPAAALDRVWTSLGLAAACTLPQALHPPSKTPPSL